MKSEIFSLDGKVALVTGAGSGIGRASALALAVAGASVVVSDVDEEAGEEAVREVTKIGGVAQFIACDVADSTSVERLIADSIDCYGKLDCAHNNAGVAPPIEAMHQYDEQDWDRTMAVNLKGVWLCMRAEIRQMLTQGGGVIVNTASVGGLKAVPGAIYCATKHGVVGLSKSAAVEYAMQGIRINAVCPGPTHSAMGDQLKLLPPDALNAVLPPLKRFADADEIACMVVFLCSPAASYLTGQAIAVDGAATA